jgi:hypothetical protein
MSQEENIESGQHLDNNEQKKPKREFEKSEHEHYSSCGCGT